MRPELRYAAEKSYLAKEQYAGMTNYQHRKNIYQHGNNMPLTEWLALQYVGDSDLSIFGEILEVGCGDGQFWKYYAPPEKTFNSHVFLTDLSEKMLEECKNNLSLSGINYNFRVADIDTLQFDKGSFDAVLAHNVMYHAANPGEAIKGIVGVLKPAGLFAMSVFNHGGNRSIWSLASSIDPKVPDRSFTSRFTDIEADEMLPKIFPKIEKRDYQNTLRFKSSEPIVKMVQSSPVVQPLKLSDNFFSLFTDKVEKIIEDNGFFESEFNASLYLCRKSSE